MKNFRPQSSLSAQDVEDTLGGAGIPLMESTPSKRDALVHALEESSLNDNASDGSEYEEDRRSGVLENEGAVDESRGDGQEEG